MIKSFIFVFSLFLYLCGFRSLPFDCTALDFCNHSTFISRDCVYLNKHNGGENYTPNYYAFTNFNMKTYFRYLSDYSPKNMDGSCSFVSLIQVMSYYDTFYNDNIIDDDFDRYNNNITTLSQAYLISPGVEKNDVSLTIGTQSFYDYCWSTMYHDFQSYLICLYNVFCNTNNANDFQNSMYSTEYHLFFDYFFGYNQVLVWTYGNNSQSYYTQFIKSMIDINHPVIVYIDDIDDGGRHAVVAYDYDENNIYANYGWTSSDTHIPLFSYGYDTIYQVTYIDFSNLPHLHSNNYLINGVGYCGCNPNNLFI